MKAKTFLSSKPPLHVVVCKINSSLKNATAARYKIHTWGCGLDLEIALFGKPR